MRGDLYHDVVCDELFPYAANTNADTAITSNIIDTQGFDSCLLAYHTHGLTDADATAVAALAESDASNMASSNAVDDADLLGTESGLDLTFADDAKVHKLGYSGKKRYIQLTVTPTGNNSGNWAASGVVILGHPRSGGKTTQTN